MTFKTTILVLFYIIFCHTIVLSQNYGASSYLGVPQSIGLTTLTNFSLINPASIVLDSNNFTVIRTKPSRFGINELSPFMLNAGVAIDDVFAVGANFLGLGGELYSEVSGELRISGKVSKSILIGLSGELSRLSIKNYRNHTLGFLNFGAIIEISDNLTTGFLLRNILRNYSEAADRTANQQSVVGFAYRVNNEVSLELDASVMINSSSAISFAISYIPHEAVSVRSAFRTNPNLFEVAAMVNVFSDINLMLGLEYNEILGISPELAIRYAF